MEFGSLSGRVIAACIEVHRVLGPGLLEGIYARAVRRELSLAGMRTEAEVLVPVVYKGEQLESPLRIDLVVENAMVLELKAVESLLPVHAAQLLTYLRLTRFSLGLLINFNVPRLRDGGIKRIMNDYRPS